MPEDLLLHLACPRCGAPLPGEASRQTATCKFCGTASVPAADRRLVPHGGSEGSRCPRCRGMLFEGRAGDVVVLGCGGCGGIWVDNENAQRALASPTREAAQLSAVASRAARLRVSTAAEGLPCPDCQRPLVRATLSPSGVEADLCQDHGTWFDRDELARVLLHRTEASPADPFPVDRSTFYPQPHTVQVGGTTFHDPPIEPIDWGGAAGVAGATITLFAAALGLTPRAPRGEGG